MAKDRILVVDDDTSLLQLLEIMLEHEGYEIVTAENGAEGLERARTRRFDLILLDVMLPGMDGWTVLEELRAGPCPPVIMLTSLAGEDDKVHGLEGGADDYICKPFSNRELIARIRKEIRKSRNLLGAQEFAAGELHVNFHTHEVRLRGRRVHLTPIQWRIFHVLLEHPGRVVTADELLRAGWVEKPRMNHESLKVQIHHLRAKLQDPAECPRWIVNERSNGYRFQTPNEPEQAGRASH